MKIQRRLAAFALFLSIFVFLPATTAAKDGEWRQARSKNFNLIGNADEQSILAVAVRLEQFRAALRQVFGELNFDSPVPTTVIVFKSAADYKPFKLLKANGETNNIVIGYFQPGRDVNYITLVAAENDTANYNVIFHEYTHFLIRNNLGDSVIPPWYNEGIAAYYETFAADNAADKITLGAPQAKYLTYLRQKNLIPFDTFFGIDNYTLHEQGNDGIGLFYAQAWALTHYLIQGSAGVRKPQLDKFLSLVMAGKTPKTAFAEAFQTDYSAMESELKKYIAQNVFPVSKIPLKDKLTFDTEIKSAPLLEAEAEAYLGDLLLHQNRLREAEIHLLNSLKLNPELGMAQTALGLVKLEQNDFAAAEKHLERAAQLDSGNYLAHYSYAYALSREGMSEFGFVSEYNAFLAAKMREQLKKAIELNPNFAESYNLYAFVGIVRNENIDESIEYMSKALKIAPGNQWYLVHLAELYLWKEDFTNARTIAAKVARTAADRELKVYSQNVMRLVDSTEAAYNDIKNYKKRSHKNDFLDRVLTDEEFAVLRTQKMLELLNDALYKPKANEARVLGRLSEIECAPQTMIYTVKSSGKTIKLQSPTFFSVHLTAYNSEMKDWQIGCGKVKNQTLAVINYRPSKDAGAKTSGEIFSIEFVPENFRFLN